MSKKKVNVGGLTLGNGHIYIQSMLNIPAEDVAESAAQAVRLEKAGCEIIRAAVPTLDDVPKPPEKPKRTGGTKNLQKLLNTLEREISQLETQSSDLEQQMVDAASDSGKLLELMTEKEACDEKLAAKMDEWEAVAAELEELQ